MMMMKSSSLPNDDWFWFRADLNWIWFEVIEPHFYNNAALTWIVMIVEWLKCAWFMEHDSTWSLDWIYMSLILFFGLLRVCFGHFKHSRYRSKISNMSPSVKHTNIPIANNNISNNNSNCICLSFDRIPSDSKIENISSLCMLYGSVVSLYKTLVNLIIILQEMAPTHAKFRHTRSILFGWISFSYLFNDGDDTVSFILEPSDIRFLIIIIWLWMIVAGCMKPTNQPAIQSASLHSLRCSLLYTLGLL